MNVQFNIVVQKKDSFDCGPVALINLMRFYKEKSIPTFKSLKKISSSNGTCISKISMLLDSKRIKYNRVHEPNLKKIYPRIKNGGFILLYKSRGYDPHFSMVLKMTKKYIYLTNVLNEKTDEYEQISRVKLSVFLKKTIMAIIYI